MIKSIDADSMQNTGSQSSQQQKLSIDCRVSYAATSEAVKKFNYDF